MSKSNQMNRIVSNINKLPDLVRPRALSLFFGRMVKFTGTAGISVEELTPNRCVIRLKNRKSVQNHIGSVHAVATILIAESATGYLVGMNVPDRCVPVIKTIKADYVKRAKGDMQAVAELSAEQIRMMQTQDKGETLVKVSISDGEGKEPVVAEMLWAWTPKKR